MSIPHRQKGPVVGPSLAPHMGTAIENGWRGRCGKLLKAAVPVTSRSSLPGWAPCPRRSEPGHGGVWINGLPPFLGDAMFLEVKRG